MHPAGLWMLSGQSSIHAASACAAADTELGTEAMGHSQSPW